MYEIEVKGQLNITIDAAIESLKENGFKFGEVQLQDDTIFARRWTDIIDPSAGAAVCRVRNERDKSTLTLKMRTELALSKVEHETTVGNPEEAGAILRSLGLKEIMRIQKSRCIGRSNELTVCLDEVQDLGDFVEFEVIYREKPDISAEQEKLHETAERLLPGQFTQVFAGYDELTLARMGFT